MNTKKILTDVDGCILEWDNQFTSWLEEKHGIVQHTTGRYKIHEMFDITEADAKRLVRQFNESAWIGYLPPLRDALEVIRRLTQEGYHFQAITSLSNDEFSNLARRQNLYHHFGTDMNCMCLDTGADKDAALAQFSPDSWWIEDKPENCDAGIKAGMKCILMDHTHNKHYHHPDVYRVHTWRNIYELITGREFI